MAQSKLDTQIRDRITAFVDELAGLVRAAAIESVTEALEGDGAAPVRRRGPGRPRKGTARKEAAGRPRGRRARRSSGDVDATAAAVASHVRSNPGQTVTEIGDALGMSSKDLKLPIQKLLGEKQVRTTGQRRGTRYHPAGGRGSAGKKAGAPRRKKKAGRKKAGKKRTARKKTAKKRTTKKATTASQAS